MDDIPLREEIFRKYDIRGIVGRDINGSTAFEIGKAFGTYLKEIHPQSKKVCVGRDVRLSSGELSERIIKALSSTGLDVINIGVCPTPVQYFSLYHLGLDGGIMITGSHNPPEYNGFKLSAGKETIFGEAIQRIKEIIVSGEGISSGMHGEIEQYDIIKSYEEFMLKEFSYLADSGYRRIRVVIDSGNGTAGLIVPDLLSAVGCDVIPIYCEPDGRFPNHHPDPTVVEYIQDLIAKTRETGADFGVGYDGDADRMGIVDRSGNIIWGDRLMIILSRELLKRKPRAKIIADVKCSEILFEDIKQRGGVPIMWKTGHSLIKEKMRVEGAELAGEFSGHIFIADGYFGYDDAIYATLRLVEIMKKRGRDLGELLLDIPELHYTPEIRIECSEEIKNQVVEDVTKRLGHYRETRSSPHYIRDLNTIDGVRIVFDRGWGLMRVSNTQPVVVMRCEAQDEESLHAYRMFLEREFSQAKKRIELDRKD
jgi:phosphomannomutase/phosphoglucomutase